MLPISESARGAGMTGSVLASLFLQVRTAGKVIPGSGTAGPEDVRDFILLAIVKFHSKEAVPVYIPVKDV